MQFTRKIVLSLLIIVLCSAMAFASEESPDPEQAPLEVDWRSLDLQTSAGAVRAVEKTVTDVYNLLDDIFYGDSPYSMGILAQIADMLDFEAGNTSYTIADLQGMTWQIASSINNQLTSTNSILGNIYNNIGTTNAKLEYVFSAIEDTINIKWYSTNSLYAGTRLSIGGENLTSLTQSSSFYSGFSFSGIDNPQLVRIEIPVSRYGFGFTSPLGIKLNSITSGSSNVVVPDYFVTNTNTSTYIYLFDFNFPQSSSLIYWFNLTFDGNLTFYPNGSASVVSIPFDTLDYQIIKTAFNQAKSAKSLDELKVISSTLSSLANSVSAGSDAAEALADYFVSPEKQAAEDASSQVINSTLNNFTGNGSGAAKSSDSNAMKDVSGSIQSGLNGGGSVSGATGVFNSGSDFWGWFTQQNSNYINNPYPAPTVNSTRGSGDEIVDFLTPNSNELQDLLRQGGDQR